MKELFEGKVTLWGKIYNVKVEGGERYTEVNGRWLTTDEFIETLTPREIENLAVVGRAALDDELLGREPEKGKYQYLAEELPKLLE